MESLDAIFEVQPTYHPMPTNGDLPPVSLLIYRDTPEKGLITGLTIGMSFVDQPCDHPQRHELMICVESNDALWVLALATVACTGRGNFHFSPGETIAFNAKISDQSSMTSFLVWYQNVFDAELEIIRAPDWDIKVVQLFPIHDDERVLIEQHGTEWFFPLVEDPWDVTRKSIAERFESLA